MTQSPTTPAAHVPAPGGSDRRMTSRLRCPSVLNLAGGDPPLDHKDSPGLKLEVTSAWTSSTQSVFYLLKQTNTGTAERLTSIPSHNKPPAINTPTASSRVHFTEEEMSRGSKHRRCTSSFRHREPPRTTMHCGHKENQISPTTHVNEVQRHSNE